MEISIGILLHFLVDDSIRPLIACNATQSLFTKKSRSSVVM